eukprot:1962709-Prymnesium_polylepis.1
MWSTRCIAVRCARALSPHPCPRPPGPPPCIRPDSPRSQTAVPQTAHVPPLRPAIDRTTHPCSSPSQ